MLCSILLPSRERFGRLLRTIKSIQDAAVNKNEVEFLIRLDDDDKSSLDHQDKLWAIPNTKVFVGPRKRGYFSLPEFYSYLARSSGASWVWIMNDDVIVDGRGWDEELEHLPLWGTFVQAETHSMDGVLYYSEFPIVPNGCWMKLAGRELDGQMDRELFDILVTKAGWTTYLFKQTRAHHQRDPDHIINAWHGGLPK